MGACLLLREKSRRSARPALRSSASLFVQPSSGVLEEPFFLEGLVRDAEALARAPKEICSAAEGSGSDSSEEESDYRKIK